MTRLLSVDGSATLGVQEQGQGREAELSQAEPSRAQPNQTEPNRRAQPVMLLANFCQQTAAVAALWCRKQQ